MEIKPGKFVVLTYDLYAGAGEPEETLMMRATDEMPDQFVFGVDQNILPSMLKRLEGLKQGDKFDFVLSCEEAFGERNEEHVMELDKEIFMVDGKFDDQTVFEGNTVPMMTSEGYRINGSVLKVTDDKVLMDFNHPLAGENLHYVGTVKPTVCAPTFSKTYRGKTNTPPNKWGASKEPSKSTHTPYNTRRPTPTR